MKKNHSIFIILAALAAGVCFAQSGGRTIITKTKGDATFTVASSAADRTVRMVSDARCNNTDDDNEINGRITAAGTLGGGKISLSEGTFTIGDKIDGANKIWIQGKGESTIIKRHDDSADSAIINCEGVTDFWISDCVLDGNSDDDEAVFGIVFSQTSLRLRIWNVTIKNCTFAGSRGIFNNSSSAGPTDCYIANCTIDNINGTGMYLNDIGDSYNLFNKVSNCTDGIWEDIANATNNLYLLPEFDSISGTEMTIDSTSYDFRASEIDAAYTHISSDGTDHTYINQDLRTNANVVFGSLSTVLISSASPIDIKPSGNDDDYLEFTTNAGIPKIKIHGGAELILESSDATANQFKMYGTADGVEHFKIQYDKGASKTFLLSTGPLDLKANGDSTDYIQLTTIANVPTIGTVGDCDLEITSSSGRVGIGTSAPDRPLELRTENSIMRIRDTGNTEDDALAYIEFGGTTGGSWDRTGYVGDSSSGDTHIRLCAEDGDLILGDSSGVSVLTLSGGDVTASGNFTSAGATFNGDGHFDATTEAGRDANWDASEEEFIFQNLAQIVYGADKDVRNYWDGDSWETVALAANTPWNIGDNTTGFDMKWWADLGSVVFEYSDREVFFDDVDIRFADDDYLYFGTGYDVEIFFNTATNTFRYDASANNSMMVWDAGTNYIRADSRILALDKIFFTQADADEYIDSLNDGYMDYGATTAHRFNNSVGIGTTAVPHGGVGWAKFAIDGTNANAAGPHIQFTTSSDSYPLMQILNYRHDDISIRFDSYWDEANRSSDAGSNYAIFKINDLFKIMYDSGVAQGSAITYNDGIVLNTSGNVGIGTATPSSKLSINGGLHVGGDSDAGDNNLLVDGALTTTDLTATGVITVKTKGTANFTIAPYGAPADLTGIADYACDNDDDDSVEFMAAVNALPAGGGEIYCYSGSYSFKNSVELNSNTTLRFANGNYITLPADHALDEAANQETAYTETVSALIFARNETKVRVIGANMDWEDPTGAARFATNQAYAGVWFDQCEDSRIEDCNFIDIVYDVDLANGHHSFGALLSECKDSGIYRCRAEGVGYEGFGIRGDSYRCIIDECHGEDNKVHLAQAASWTDSFLGAPKYCTISRCTGEGDVILHGRDGNGSVGNSLLNNQVQQVRIQGEQSGGIVSGNTCNYLVIRGGGGAAEELVGANVTGNTIIYDAVLSPSRKIVAIDTLENNSVIEELDFSNNTLINGYMGITSSLAGKDGIIRNISLSNNTFSAGLNNIHGIWAIHNTTGLWFDWKVSDNNFQLDPTFSPAAAFIIDMASSGDFRKVLFDDNMVLSDRGVRHIDGSGDGALEHLTISSNTFDTDGSNGQVFYHEQNVDFVNIINNVIKDCDYVLGSTHAATNVIITGNIVHAVDDAFTDGTSTDVHIENNYGAAAGGMFGGIHRLQYGRKASKTSDGSLLWGDVLMTATTGFKMLYDGVVLGHMGGLDMTVAGASGVNFEVLINGAAETDFNINFDTVANDQQDSVVKTYAEAIAGGYTFSAGDIITPWMNLVSEPCTWANSYGFIEVAYVY